MATQRSTTVKERSVSGGTALDKIDQLVLPTNFGPIVRAAVKGALTVKAYLSPEEQEQFDGSAPEGSRRWA